MITHEEAKECISRLFDSYVYGDFIPFPTRSDLDTISLYITQQETLQVEHESLKKELAKSVGYCSKIQNELNTLKNDVARYFELNEQAREKWGNGIDDKEAYELTRLHIKLSKVGKE